MSRSEIASAPEIKSRFRQSHRCYVARALAPISSRAIRPILIKTYVCYYPACVHSHLAQQRTVEVPCKQTWMCAAHPGLFTRRRFWTRRSSQVCHLDSPTLPCAYPALDSDRVLARRRVQYARRLPFDHPPAPQGLGLASVATNLTYLFPSYDVSLTA